MTNCTNLYKSKKVQAYLNKMFKKNASELIKETGGLPEFYWRDFKKGFHKGFMETCKKTIIKKNRKNNSTKKNKSK